MLKSKELFWQVTRQIKLDESRDEIESMVYLLLEKVLGLSKADIVANSEIELPHEAELTNAIHRINQQEPIQYIIEEADFYGRAFFVNKSVLIPRPETELLVSTIIKNTPSHASILDVGTGSGCIAITLSLELPSSHVTAVDISEPALTIAKKNHSTLGGSVNFIMADIFQNQIPISELDIIVSNPPYISKSEKAFLKKM
ncbi:MAG: peptide chain release factor N(5)-glutamine methyltransferase [Flammeovirgaceae bacterium]|nr:peptide chain release factor N(5)-glutamine methyltransferase [Flammeovirgaceae bacterium]